MNVIKDIEATGLQPEDLKDLVHEVANSMAATANNGGVREQVAFLMQVGGLSVADIQRWLSGEEVE